MLNGILIIIIIIDWACCHGKRVLKVDKNQSFWIMNIEGFAFCNCSFFFSWLNSHSILLVRVKLWSSKDSCKKSSLCIVFLLFWNLLIFLIFFFVNHTFPHFCLITSLYTFFLWSFLLYCALTQGCSLTLSYIAFSFLWKVLILFTWIYSRIYTLWKQNSSQESYFLMNFFTQYYVLEVPRK